MAEYLVTAEWLQAALADNNNRPVKLVEATFFLPTMNRDALAEFQEAHLPGAVFFDIDAVSQADNPLPHMLPTSEQFAAEISKMGIEDTDHIVIYDRSPLFQLRGHGGCSDILDIQKYLFWMVAIKAGWRQADRHRLAPRALLLPDLQPEHSLNSQQ